MADRIVVVGGGSMGAGIAAVAAASGYAVVLVEPQAEARERAAVRAGSVQVVAEIPSDDGVEIAIEAVPERLDLKEHVFAEMERSLPGAVLATNTSSLSVAEIGRATSAPERVIGLHFFNPPEKMQLVEIVRAPQSADYALERGRAFVERIGKTGVVAADTPGFIVNRVARPFYVQAMRALDAGVARVEELDALARGAGFRMGPFELMDFIGLDVNLATSQSVYARLQAERLAPVALQRALVAQGRLGRKSGAGFYSYLGTPPRIDLRTKPRVRRSEDEHAAVLGAGGLADELAAALDAHFAPVTRFTYDEEVEHLDVRPTLLFDVGDGESDRGVAIARLDALLDPACAIFVDAYATDLDRCATKMRHPDRLVGYGVLGSLAEQDGVEIVDADATSDEMLELAQESFEAIGHGVVLVENVPGLFLGRTIGAIVNEAVIAVEEGVAAADDVDAAMRLGTNYPRGPIAWGREIGGHRISRILRRVAALDGEAFLPHRALWVLDVDEESVPAMPANEASWLPNAEL